jgi:hypothetical protein
MANDDMVGDARYFGAVVRDWMWCSDLDVDDSADDKNPSAGA